MRKKDLASMFSYDSKRKLYYCRRTKDGKSKQLYSKDPEMLLKKVNAFLNPNPPTFSEVAKEWKNRHWEEIEETTAAGYVASYNRAIEALGNKLLQDITPNDIMVLITRLKSQGYSKKCIKVQKQTVSMVFDYALANSIPNVTWNPATAVKIPRGLPKTSRPAPDENAMEIIRKNKNSPNGLFPYFCILR